MMYKQRTDGFALVELLVVVAIIAVLLSILMEGLTKARVQARRVVCSSNLHQWGIVHHTYASDNDGELLATDPQYGGRYPSLMGSAPHPTGINIYSLENYIKGADASKQEIGEIWNCADTEIEWFTDLLQYDWNKGYFHVPYSYFARSSLWEIDNPLRPDSISNMGALAEIMDNDMSSDKILMTDTLYLQTAGAWVYNHGENGPSTHDWGPVRSGYHDRGVPPSFTGINRMFGDGHVKWKSVTEFYAEGMQNSLDRTLSFSIGTGGGWGDRSYW